MTDTNTTSDAESKLDTNSPVIEAEKEHKTNLQEHMDKEDELAEKIHNMIKEKKDQAKNFATYTRDYFLDEEHSEKIQRFLNTALIAAIVLVVYGLYGSMMSYLLLALQQSNGLGGIDLNLSLIHI